MICGRVIFRSPRARPDHHPASPSPPHPQSHSSCVTEHDKYAKGATKPGGFAAGGFFGGGGGSASAPTAAPGEPVGARHLTTRPPWRCTLCNVAATSRETLAGHAAGAKHVRRARAADRVQAGGGEEGKGEVEVEAVAAAAAAPATPAKATTTATTADKKKKAKVPQWRKLGVAALVAIPKRKLRLGALSAAVLAAAGVAAGDADAAAAAEAAIQGSSRFVVKRGKVRLAAA